MGNNTCNYVDGFGHVNRNCFMSCHSPGLKEALRVCSKIPRCLRGFAIDRHSVAGCVVKAVDGVSRPVAPTAGKSHSVGLCVGRIDTRVVEGRERRVLATGRRSVHTLTNITHTILTGSRVYIVKGRTGVRRRGRLFVAIRGLF